MDSVYKIMGARSYDFEDANGRQIRGTTLFCEATTTVNNVNGTWCGKINVPFDVSIPVPLNFGSLYSFGYSISPGTAKARLSIISPVKADE